MRLTNHLGNGIGLIALAASFALASPGVRVVHAETLASREAPAQCRATAARRHSKDAEIGAFVDRLRNQAPRSAASEGPKIVVLNNRGYNYGAGRIELDALLVEADARR